MKDFKKIACIFLISLFALSAFAAPGGGGSSRGGPGGGRGGIGSGMGGRTGAPSAPGGQHSAPASSPSASSTSHSASSNPYGIINYRGARTAATKNFSLQTVKSKKTDNGTMSLEIRFNQSVNPHSFTADSILVNGEAIFSDKKPAFNKKGDTVKISLPNENEIFSLKIQNIESFDGKKLESVELKDISAGSTLKNLEKSGGKND